MVLLNCSNRWSFTIVSCSIIIFFTNTNITVPMILLKDWYIQCIIDACLMLCINVEKTEAHLLQITNLCALALKLLCNCWNHPKNVIPINSIPKGFRMHIQCRARASTLFKALTSLLTQWLLFCALKSLQWRVGTHKSSKQGCVLFWY